MNEVRMDEVMADADIDVIIAADSGVEILEPAKPEFPWTSRWKSGGRVQMKQGHFENAPIEVMDNDKPMKLKRRILSHFSNYSTKTATILPPPSKHSGSYGICHASMRHGEGQDGCNPDDRAAPPLYPCESGVMQANWRAEEEGKQSGVQQLDNSSQNSIADDFDEDDDGDCVLKDLLEVYDSDSAEPSEDGNLEETERVLLALETATPLATSVSTVAPHNCGVGMRLNQEMLVKIMRPGGPLQSRGKILFGDMLVRVDDMCSANLEIQAFKDLVLGKVRTKVSLYFTHDVVVVIVHLHRATAPASHLNVSRSPLRLPVSEACGTYSYHQCAQSWLVEFEQINFVVGNRRSVVESDFYTKLKKLDI